MVRFIHTADWHIGMENYSRIDPQTGLSSRLGDFVRSMDSVIDYAIQEKVDFFLFAGDAYKTREPTPTHQREFAKRILKLSKASIPCVLLVGNHDTPNAFGKANSLDIYSALEIENVFVLKDPTLITIKNVQIAALPWLSRKEFEEVDKVMDEVYKNVDPTLPLVVAAHASVSDAVFGSERSVSLGGDLVVSKETLTRNAATVYVALGHIHKRQELPGKIPIVYSGSIERVDFGEEFEEKSFELVTIEGSTGSWHATSTPITTQARKFLTIKIDLAENDSDPTQTILDEIKNYTIKDSVVKVILNFAPNSNADIRIADIKSALSDAFIVAAIQKNITRSLRNQLGEGVIAEQLNPTQLLEKYFQSKGFSDTKIHSLLGLAKELMEEGL